MDITDQILDHHRRYGSSDFTAQFATASSRALNYANGASIQRPEQERVTNIPRQLSYQDSWLDVRLYKKNRDEHPYDVLYVGTEDYFYIGFHARNTRRLAYNVSCMLGVSSEGNDDGYLRIEDIPEELLNLSL